MVLGLALCLLVFVLPSSALPSSTRSYGPTQPLSRKTQQEVTPRPVASGLPIHHDTLNSYPTTPIPELPPGLNVSFSAIPSLWYERCNEKHSPPCTLYCRNNDTACITAARSVVSRCSASWSSYADVQTAIGVLPSSGGWTAVTQVTAGKKYIDTTSIYTSFSTTNTTWHGFNPMNGVPTTITPVYALGTPWLSRSTGTWANITQIWRTAPTPECRYGAVYAATTRSPHGFRTSSGCGQCTIYGGNVQLYWWPSLSEPPHLSNATATQGSSPARSTVLSGTTLISPTVYISLHKLHAQNSCDQNVGTRVASTLLAMNPTDVSTLVHNGDMAAASGANFYGTLNFDHLTGLPRVSDYEMQPSCVYGGCPTILPIPFSPTLVVPSQVRSMDPAWESCEAGLEGL